ncbi:MAG: recombination protein RecR [Rhodobiaceae bacterium]|nr:recombination protein RecR [Rhodobiaceae bacterium]|tara:strand:+ start:170 stop:757 length:588 start_codon:yes stop_codon:yes gene_type:complete
MAGAEIENLVKLLARLPGLGPRSARRAVLQMMRRRETLLDPLSEALMVARDKIVSCTICGNIDTLSPCTICADSRRDGSVLCVVEDVGDLWALERAQAVKGRYHVLGGTLSALDGIGPDDLNLGGLKQRCADNAVKEIILATNATVEGQTTAHVITDMLSDMDVTITRLAHGVPVGGELDYLDDGTLLAAMKSRR